jgi:hypothetical protein
MHGFAGIVLFLSALVLIIATDGLLRLPAFANGSSKPERQPRGR